MRNHFWNCAKKTTGTCPRWVIMCQYQFEGTLFSLQKYQVWEEPLQGLWHCFDFTILNSMGSLTSLPTSILIHIFILWMTFQFENCQFIPILFSALWSVNNKNACLPVPWLLSFFAPFVNDHLFIWFLYQVLEFPVLVLFNVITCVNHSLDVDSLQLYLIAVNWIAVLLI